jgi:F-type H+-transporting ATPase subunit delta
MADRSLARRYARAFIEIAEETNQSEKLGVELNTVLSSFRSHEDMLLEALSNPVYTKSERSGVLEAVLPKLNISATMQNTLRLMLRNNRMALLPMVTEEFQTYADQRANRARVVVETAEPLTPQLEAEVRAALEGVTGKTVLIETRVKPELIGGVVARIGGKVYDASVQSRLSNLKKTLLSSEISDS